MGGEGVETHENTNDLCNALTGLNINDGAANNENSNKNSISKAKELLSSTELYVEPFDSCGAALNRRITIKRLCHGRVNTITNDVSKIDTISQEIVDGLKSEQEEDDDVKERITKEDPEVSVEQARGHQYFINLLSREVRVRIEAEGFNGPRGDGFPLAAFVATVASKVPEFVPIFEAYVYDTCPLALPVSFENENDQKDFSESLGMKKEKDGEFESFERFLQRTEGLISFMADVMSTKPSDHNLFKGHQGGIDWLESFVEQLIKYPGHLPLFVAPVLFAFLSGAGHMLANMHAEKFKVFLQMIKDDVLQRLDEGPIGAPSAHRLKECMEGGFDTFKEHQPSKALGTRYNNGRDGPLPPPPPPAWKKFQAQNDTEKTYPPQMYRAQSYDSAGIQYYNLQYNVQYNGTNTTNTYNNPYATQAYGTQPYSNPYSAQSYGTQPYSNPYSSQLPVPGNSTVYSTSANTAAPENHTSYGFAKPEITRSLSYAAPSPSRRKLGEPSPVGRSRRILAVSSWNKPQHS